MTRSAFLAWAIALGYPLAAQSSGAVSGIVRSSEGALAGARVESCLPAARPEVTDSAGRFTFSALPAGPCTLSVTLSGWAPATATVNVRDGATTPVTITLARIGSLAPVTVAAADGSYAATRSSGATKFPVPNLDLPQDVAAVTRAVIDDRSITEMRDLTKNVSGVTVAPSFNGGGHNEVNFVFRGTQSDAWASNSLRDGFREYAMLAPRDMASVDHVEFLKGPASVLYGSEGSFGGIANFISRAPLPRPEGEAELSGDTFGALRATLDLGGPVTSSGTVLYRLDAAAERLNSFRDYSNGLGMSLAAAFSWAAGPSTSLTLRGEFTQRRYRMDPMLPWYSGMFSLPISRYYAEPAFAPDIAGGVMTQLTLTQRLGSAWMLREGLSYVRGSENDRGVAFFPIDSGATMLDRLYGQSGDASVNGVSQTELIADLSSGSIRNRLVFGLELSVEQTSHWDTDGDSLASINLANPVYGAVPTDTGIVGGIHATSQQAGLYGQDLIDLGQSVKLVFGARLDLNQTNATVHGSGYWTDTIGAAHQTVRHLSPKAGIVVQPGASTSLYFAWSTSFLPNLSTPSHGDAAVFPPELGEQFEVGVKQEWAGGRFGATLAAYQLVRRNVLVWDPTDPHFPPRSIIQGENESRGIELDASGSLAPGLGLVLAYAFTQEMLDPRQPGSWVTPNLPEQRGSLWTHYTVQGGALRGFAVGAGVTAATFQYADYDNVLHLPAYAIVDAMLGYQFAAFTLQVNGYNLTNAVTYISSPGYSLEPGASRSLKTTIAYHW